LTQTLDHIKMKARHFAILGLFIVLVAAFQLFRQGVATIQNTEAKRNENNVIHGAATTSSETKTALPPSNISSRSNNNKNNNESQQKQQQRVNVFDTVAEDAVAWSNTTVVGFKEARLWSGFRNQMIVFKMFTLHAIQKGYRQMLMETLPELDCYGSNEYIPFHVLWDIPHWNSYYPVLPRLVHYDPNLHGQFFDPEKRIYYKPGERNNTNSTNLGLFEIEPKGSNRGDVILFIAHGEYVEGKGPYVGEGNHRNPVDILLLKEAMRPHPRLQEIIDSKLRSLRDDDDGGGKTKPGVEFMALHARIEPDMQRHSKYCKPKKVLKLRDIFNWIEAKWPEPPAKHIFMPINRERLELDGSEAVVESLKQQNKEKEINWIAVDNLQALNHARDHGLWNGTARVFEFGAKAMAGTEYSHRPSTTGSMVNFFIAIDAKIFIGTEVSSWSHDLLATRFFRGNMENYKYLPDGLHHWTPPGTEDPPGFHC